MEAQDVGVSTATDNKIFSGAERDRQEDISEINNNVAHMTRIAEAEEIIYWRYVVAGRQVKELLLGIDRYLGIVHSPLSSQCE